MSDRATLRVKEHREDSTVNQPQSVIQFVRTALGPDADAASDAELLRRFVAQRDQAAFELIVWRYGSSVLRMARSTTRDHQMAEDVAQATFLALARQARRISNGQAIGAWLGRVAQRIAVRQVSKRRATPAEGLEQIAASASADVDGDAVRLLVAEVSKLPDKYRAPVMLCFFDGLSHSDAAQRLGWPVGTVSARISRAKEQLRRRLTGRVVVPAVGVAGLLSTTYLPALTPTFAADTARAAQAIASGETPQVSLAVLEMSKGAIRTVTMNKIQWAACAMIACGVVVAGVTVGTGQVPSPFDKRPKAAPPSPSAEPDPAPVVVRNADLLQRQRSLKNLRTLMLAIHNYHDTYGRLPADIPDKNGKAILSWRVEILPFMEQDALYKQFRKNESWDSEHNLQLLSKMPEVLRVGFEAPGATHTCYQRFALVGGVWQMQDPFGAGAMGGEAGSGGPGAGGALPGIGGPPPGLPGGTSGPRPTGSGGGAPGLPGPGGTSGPPPAGFGAPLGGPGLGGGGGLRAGEGGGLGGFAVPTRFPVSFAEITDGTSNTIGVIEAGPAVAWTKPDDIEYDASKPVPKLVGPFANVRNVVMMDGTTSSWKPVIEDRVMRMLISPNDGNVIPPLRTLRANFPADTAEEKAVLAKIHTENKALSAEVDKKLKELSALILRHAAAANDIGTAEDRREELKRILEELQQRANDLREDLGEKVNRPGMKAKTPPMK